MAWSALAQGSRVLIDTAPFIYILEDHPEFAQKFTGLFEAAQQGHIRIALTSITLAEVLTGPHRAGRLDLAKRYQTALEQYDIVAVSTPIAALAAQLRIQYRLKLPDAIQLAAALEIGADALVTHDRDFSQVTGLPVMMGE
jgi:predicted nucleic acid-binding protein